MNEPPGRFSHDKDNVADESTQPHRPYTWSAPAQPVTPRVALETLPRPRKRQARQLRLALVIFSIFVLLFGGTLSVGYLYYVHNIQQPLTQFIRPVDRGKNEPPPNSIPVYDTIKGRSWNILLLGSDNDHKYNFPAVLTQVMMVVHVDTVTNSVYMVSLPRDSWVNVPDVGGMHKIDQAFLLGTDNNKGFEGGVQMVRTAIEKDFGITIDRYAWVGLDGFARVIDTLGGVDIDITHPIVDDTYPDDTGAGADPHNPYAFKRLYLEPGPQHLDGEQALEYVRSRHADQIGDIGRTQRQQQVLEALKQKLTISSVVNNLSALIKDLSGQVYTDMNQQEMLAFANYGQTLSSSAIQRITLGPGSQDFSDNANVYDPSIGANQDVIIPHCDKIEPVLISIFGSANCNVTG